MNNAMPIVKLVRRAALAAGACAVALFTATAGPAAAATPVATEFSAGISGLPGSITAGPDGNLWFTESNGQIGRITPSGTVTEFSAGISGIPVSITAGPDGNLWFADGSSGNRIGRITPSGVVTEFSAGISGIPESITAGPDGNLWFTEPGVGQIGRITPAGSVMEFSAGISVGITEQMEITAGPDGNLWFTVRNTVGSQEGIGRITPSGNLISPPSQGDGISLADITAGPDGNLWFAERGTDRIGRTDEVFLGMVRATTFSAGISPGATPTGIAAGPDGNLWFAEEAGRIGRITPSGSVTEFSAGISAGAFPHSITAGPDGNLWFTERAGGRIGRINTALDPPAFRNEDPISIPDSGTDGKADPYPSTIAVSGLQGTVTDVQVRLTGLSHGFPDDLDALLVGPRGERALLASDAGGGDPPANGVTLNLRDSAPFALPNGDPLVSGIFRPADYVGGGSLDPPAPPLPYGKALSAFDGTNPNGAWNLYLLDGFPPEDGGALYGGWGLDIQTTGPPAGAATLPSNAFRLGKLKRNKKKGIATLIAFLPGPGEIGLRGPGIKPIRAGSARASRFTPGGRVKLKIKPHKKGKKARKLRLRLRNKGKAKRKVRVTYIPTGGLANTKKRKVKLVKK